MRTTIDAAGRIVVPKVIRDAMQLSAGRAIDVTFVDGRIEIELAPAEVQVAIEDGLPVVRPLEDLPPLTDEIVRDTLDSTRR
ncbi:AbrB/MazE/SpoVT family DNA-binding domain-containing protein [Ornithinimicrobium sp. F0845]|uniref:AbrB/MazE/SpoVT family DNA-binding domain-containing protein n=1 Tax=Ornithinimicrobium sp. F0845 TaxID=2926412 RepID=UPI001FF474B4|nr:AbrB/MazE/SpoVT family DNA-binding domain-containing protein [Ornithinimicrobium sp. F0845]MCK0112625.1 AbrB/MazE/SpoVT family DNA-binding domain-containing protein [Ornithinimicrobium sp. F0845]